MTEVCGRQPGGEIGETGKAGDFKAERACLDNFEYCGHADGICARPLDHPNLGGRFVLRSENTGIDALVQYDVDLMRSAPELFLQS